MNGRERENALMAGKSALRLRAKSFEETAEFDHLTHDERMEYLRYAAECRRDMQRLWEMM